MKEAMKQRKQQAKSEPANDIQIAAPPPNSEEKNEEKGEDETVEQVNGKNEEEEKKESVSSPVEKEKEEPEGEKKEEEGVNPSPAKPISGGGTNGMPSWAEFQKMLEQEGESVDQVELESKLFFFDCLDFFFNWIC